MADPKLDISSTFETLDEFWHDLEQRALIKAGAPESYIKKQKSMFYAGAYAVMKLAKHPLVDLEQIQAEINDYLKQVIEEHK